MEGRLIKGADPHLKRLGQLFWKLLNQITCTKKTEKKQLMFVTKSYIKRTLPSINILVTLMIFWGCPCFAQCISIGLCTAAALCNLLAACCHSFLAPLFHSATVQSALSLPLANKSWVLLSNAPFRHAQHPQAHDGGCLLGKLLRLLPKNKKEFSSWRLWSPSWFCVRVCGLTTVKICISCLQQSPLTGKLGPESVAPWKTTNCQFLSLFCASFFNFTR